MIPVSQPYLNGNEEKYLKEAIDSNWLGWKGGYVDKVEKAFAEFVGTKYAMTVTNGTTALHLALLGLGIKSGDEVIAPTMTFASTNFAISYCGATPVFIDCGDTWNINADTIESKITDKTKAIMVAHIMGVPCDMNKIMEVANKYNLPVIEDSTEALGATVGDKKVGSIGKVGTFSFYSNKQITCGEGGMVVTNDEKLYDHMNHLRNMAMLPDYYHNEIGYNYRLNNTSCAILLAQLEQVELYNLYRYLAQVKYYKCLKDTKQIQIVPEVSYGKSVCWIVSVLAQDVIQLREYLNKYDIVTRRFFQPNH